MRILNLFVCDHLFLFITNVLIFQSIRDSKTSSYHRLARLFWRDFGLSVALSYSTMATTTFNIRGTTRWMAIELLLPDSSLSDSTKLKHTARTGRLGFRHGHIRTCSNFFFAPPWNLVYIIIDLQSYSVAMSPTTTNHPTRASSSPLRPNNCPRVPPTISTQDLLARLWRLYVNAAGR